MQVSSQLSHEAPCVGENRPHQPLQEARPLVLIEHLHIGRGGDQRCIPARIMLGLVPANLISQGP